MSEPYQQIFIYFVPQLEILLDVRAFNMELSYLSYIEGVKVEIYLSGILIKTGYTDANGTYKTNVAAGDYVIVLSKEGYNTVTKTETLTRPTELMVNLPTKVSYYGRSGMFGLFLIDGMGNPTIQTIPDIQVLCITKTANISTIPSITVK